MTLLISEQMWAALLYGRVFFVDQRLNKATAASPFANLGSLAQRLAKSGVDLHSFLLC
jgi:hypothetical protein